MIRPDSKMPSFHIIWQSNSREAAIKLHLLKRRAECFKQLTDVVREMDSGNPGSHIKVCYKWILMFITMEIPWVSECIQIEWLTDTQVHVMFMSPSIHFKLH